MFDDMEQVEKLLTRLEELEAREPEPAERAAWERARLWLLEQIRVRAAREGLAVYRSGDNLGAINLCG